MAGADDHAETTACRIDDRTAGSAPVVIGGVIGWRNTSLPRMPPTGHCFRGARVRQEEDSVGGSNTRYWHAPGGDDSRSSGNGRDAVRERLGAECPASNYDPGRH